MFLNSCREAFLSTHWKDLEVESAEIPINKLEMSAVGLLSRRDFFCFPDFSYLWNTNLRILKQKKKHLT